MTILSDPDGRTIIFQGTGAADPHALADLLRHLSPELTHVVWAAAISTDEARGEVSESEV